MKVWLIQDNPGWSHDWFGKWFGLVGDGLAAYQLVGGVMAYQGGDG